MVIVFLDCFGNGFCYIRYLFWKKVFGSNILFKFLNEICNFMIDSFLVLLILLMIGYLGEKFSY